MVAEEAAVEVAVEAAAPDAGSGCIKTMPIVILDDYRQFEDCSRKIKGK